MSNASTPSTSSFLTTPVVNPIFDQRGATLNLLTSRVFGHRDQCSYLARLVEKNLVPHAMLFAGPPGVGKRTLAHALAEALLSIQSDEQSSTAPEEMARLVRTGNHPDFHLVLREDGKRDINVEAVRTLSSALQLRSYYGRGSVALIDNAHQMNQTAANALLKTLEEPNPNSYLILVTDSPQRLLETVLSRCQVLHFSELSPEDTQKTLERTLGSVELTSACFKSLHTLAKGSLASLGLDPFINPLTSGLNPGKAVANHLETLVKRRVGLLDSFERLTEDSATLTRAATLAAELGSDKDLLPEIWTCLRSFLDGKLRSSEAANKAGWADLLLIALESERLAHERNLSPQLHLTSLFSGVVALCGTRPYNS